MSSLSSDPNPNPTPPHTDCTRRRDQTSHAETDVCGTKRKWHMMFLPFLDKNRLQNTRPAYFFGLQSAGSIDCVPAQCGCLQTPGHVRRENFCRHSVFKVSKIASLPSLIHNFNTRSKASARTPHFTKKRTRLVLCDNKSVAFFE